MTSETTPRELQPLPDLLLQPMVESALREDLGRAGDITSNSAVPADAKASVVMAARKPGTIAGLDLARLAFTTMDPSLVVETLAQDGDNVKSGAVLMRITGSARAILSAERVALNFTSHLSGIATATAEMVAAVGTHKARICCTRKTTPGLRAIEKYAVRAGGGANHRFGLDDGVLIKDNHIAIAGSVTNAIQNARAANGHMVKIEVEVDTLEQLADVLALGVEAVLLDNMTNDDLAQAVAMTADRDTVLEASGRMSLERIPSVAATGVDLISVGGLTHSTPILDIGLDFESA
ncbi:MAG: carboxylating nicotinate-nucleotide diphosphorylase [Alphaproteobacteria bacterium]